MKHRAIFGSPGTGKSRTLIEYCREFDAQGLKTLYCSHTKAAASEAISRWGSPSKNVDVSTLHAFAFRALQVTRNQVVDDNHLFEFAENCGIPDEDDAKMCNEILAYATCTFRPPMEAYEQSSKPVPPNVFENFVRDYALYKKAHGFIDFNDMLERAAQADTLPKVQVLVVDEAQDLTPLHWRLVDHILHMNTAICVVAGDGNQALFEWSGADPHGIEKFIEQHSAEAQELEQSYRVPQAVHELALKIVAKLEKGGPTNYKPRDFKGQVMDADDTGFMHLMLKPDEDSLILYTNKFVRAEIEEELINDCISYTSVGGFPAPLQTRVGQAIRIAKTIQQENREPTEFELQTIYKGLRNESAREWSIKGYKDLLKRVQNVDLSVLHAHPDHTVYLHELDWSKPVNVRIATIHGAKGHEAKNVHLVNSLSTAAEDHALTHPDALHRLIYVAVTRASENLYIYQGDQPYEMPL